MGKLRLRFLKKSAFWASGIPGARPFRALRNDRFRYDPEAVRHPGISNRKRRVSAAASRAWRQRSASGRSAAWSSGRSGADLRFETRELPHAMVSGCPMGRLENSSMATLQFFTRQSQVVVCRLRPTIIVQIFPAAWKFSAELGLAVRRILLESRA